MTEACTDSSACDAVRIIAARPTDLPGMVQCHISCFPDQCISHMGAGFAQAFYECYISRADGLALVAIEGESNKVVGLVAGGNSRIRSEFLRCSPRQFFGTLLFRFLADSVVRAKLAHQLLQRLRRKNNSIIINGDPPSCLHEDGKNTGLLQAICVLDQYRGTTVAKCLMEAFKRACQKAGYHTLNLNVAANNTRAIAFYLKLGWKVIVESPSAIRMKLSISDRCD